MLRPFVRVSIQLDPIDDRRLLAAVPAVSRRQCDRLRARQHLVSHLVQPASLHAPNQTRSAGREDALLHKIKAGETVVSRQCRWLSGRATPGKDGGRDQSGAADRCPEGVVVGLGLMERLGHPLLEPTGLQRSRPNDQCSAALRVHYRSWQLLQ